MTSLRRILLSSIPGGAITAVKIKGVDHEFSTLPNIIEDVLEFTLNLKRVRFLFLADEPQVLTLHVKGDQKVTAANIKTNTFVQVINPELHLATLTKKGAELDMELTVEKGLGYLPSEARKLERLPIGTIVLDALFSPIVRVEISVENMRVGDRTDFNRLRMFIETDGTISSREVLEQSIETMIHQLRAIVGFKEEGTSDLAVPARAESIKGSAREERSAALDAEVLKTRITELSLPQRVEAALDNASIRTVGGLVRKREDDLLAIEGLGQKGLQDIKRSLSNLGLTLRQ